MEELPADSGRSRTGPSNATWWPSDFMQDMQSVPLVPREHTRGLTEPVCNVEQAQTPSQSASQVLWSTGTLSSPIPNGFYSIIPDKKLKEHFHAIPSPDELHLLGMEGLKADIILVDAEKDKKLSMLKQLTAALVKGLNSNPASVIKKISGLVTDFYNRPNSELSPAKTTAEEMSHLMENRGVQLLGQIRHGSCRPRAILFKVLADAVGLECKLVVGLPNDGAVERMDSHRHMSVVVVMNSVELFVDLMRFPGQLIPFSAKAVLTSHISGAGDDYPEYDSCDSPLESNSPLCSLADRMMGGCSEQSDKLQPLCQRKVDASFVNGPSLRNIMLRSTTSSDGNLSSSHSEPNIANALWRSSRKKVVAEQQGTASSSCRSEGASTSNSRKSRRRSFSITPEIGDDIARAVRAMSETLKQNRLLRDRCDEDSDLGIRNAKNQINVSPNKVSNYHLNCHDEMSEGIAGARIGLRKQIHSTQKATSLPSSPHEKFRGETSDQSDASEFRSKDLISAWSKVLNSSSFLKPLLPFHEWNIDFSELTVGTRVGIGFFGEVFRGTWNGTDVAIKVFLEQDLTVENMEDFCNEISILSRVRHPNVVLFLGACMKPPHLSMVSEYVEMGSLYYLIHSSGLKKKLSWRRRLKMLRDICRGLMCVHRMKIVHRDLKSANCLVSKHWVIKICDFGLSRVMTDAPITDSTSAGTPEWMAPELIRNEPFTEKCDIFSLGVIMWELCTLSRPWEGTPPVEVVYAVAHKGMRLEIPDGPLGKLIADCWAEPDERPTCQEILTRLLDCEHTLC